MIIRGGDPTRERAAMLEFILGLQRIEHAFEPNRRLDAAVAGEHLDKMLGDLAKHGGHIFIAEEDGTPIGWAVVHEGVDELYVIEQERRHAYVAELFLTEAARGRGAGRALLAACEDWARARGIGVLQIGVLPGNARARSVYAGAGFAPYTMQLRKYL